MRWTSFSPGTQRRLRAHIAHFRARIGGPLALRERARPRPEAPVCNTPEQGPTYPRLTLSSAEPGDAGDIKARCEDDDDDDDDDAFHDVLQFARGLSSDPDLQVVELARQLRCRRSARRDVRRRRYWDRRWPKVREVLAHRVGAARQQRFDAASVVVG